MKWDMKFKVRVKYFLKGKYCVQYAYYRFIPIYHSLKFWFEQDVTATTQCWSTRLLYYQDAEILAKSLKSIVDVEEWHKKEEAKKNDFYRRRREYYSINVPYDIKEFRV